ncbi:MAG: ATP-binding protein [Lachnospiraceae bacterium]|nr:ATP-binding protein [Lachnospiraceae bacterium]
MMPEISLNVLDVAQNCVRAGATKVRIDVDINRAQNTLTISIADNGCGMDEDTLAKVTDPFYTTRTTRKVGLGVSFFKQAAELTGGSFAIDSKTGEGSGTTVTARFLLDSIDRMPLGDMPGTMHTLITMHERIRWQYHFSAYAEDKPKDDSSFLLDTKELKDVLGDVPFTEPEVSAYIMDSLKENSAEVLRNAGIESI